MLSELNRAYNGWAQRIELVTDCVQRAYFLSGKIFVDPAGLTLSLRPAGYDNG